MTRELWGFLKHFIRKDRENELFFAQDEVHCGIQCVTWCKVLGKPKGVNIVCPLNDALSQ